MGADWSQAWPVTSLDECLPVTPDHVEDGRAAMQREDVIRRLAYLVRHDHTAAAMCVGWLAQEASTEALEACVELAEGSSAVRPQGDHLSIVRERYGVPPRRTP